MPPDHFAARRTLRRGGLVLFIIAALTVVYGITTRARDSQQLVHWTNEQAVTTVSTISPSSNTNDRVLELPGRLEAYARAPIYARVSGYLKNWHVDIGSQVNAGQLLAEIETPDLDQQLLQARADVASARANVELAGITAKRWQSMLETNAVSRQEVDDRVGDHAIKQALLQAAQANLDRIQATKEFTRITAPFAGVVTARTTDIGALIDAGNTNGAPLFVVADASRIRLYVNVPQNYVAAIGPQLQASVTIPERPGQTYTARLVSSSRSVDVASGATLFQFVLDNPKGELMPGAFARATLELPATAAGLSIPASALIIGQSGLQVATVDDDNRVRLKSVTIARDMGKLIELASGIEQSDRVIDNPPEDILEGQVVRLRGEGAP